jgi:hypothetical protein
VENLGSIKQKLKEESVKLKNISQLVKEQKISIDEAKDAVRKSTYDKSQLRVSMAFLAQQTQQMLAFSRNATIIKPGLVDQVEAIDFCINEFESQIVEMRRQFLEEDGAINVFTARIR